VSCGNTADFWFNTQRRVELWEAMNDAKRRQRIERTKRLHLTDAA
jgi:plasmid maintenance system antidote protein VapI